MKFARLTLMTAFVAGCAAPALTGRPLTWDQVQRVGEVTVEDPSWKGDLLRLPIRVSPAEGDLPIVLQFKGEVSENLICLTASRDDSDKPIAETYEALVELPKHRLQEYFVVYANPRGGFERLRAVQIPEKLREKLER
ncbi:MAG TPA: hypothetical protein VGH74_05245 [Planctomycetaceae bacterium]|jgi:hypothetical protein